MDPDAAMSASSTAKTPIRRRATVLEPLPNALYRLELEDASRVVAHVPARHKKDFLRLLPGDRVEVELSPLDYGRGRVTRRYK
jgi:translation initiation factor IF-1